MLSPDVFKAYDVRGVYRTELDEDGGYRIGRAFVEQFSPARVAVGHDMRVSSPSMAEAGPAKFERAVSIGKGKTPGPNKGRGTYRSEPKVTMASGT